MALIAGSCGSSDDAVTSEEAVDSVETESLADEAEGVAEAVSAVAPVAYPALSAEAAVFPTDIPGGAAAADLTTAAQFAWAEFIALNWPAMAGTRDQPDPARTFGDGQGGPLVWESFRSKVEIFAVGKDENGQPDESLLPPGYNADSADSYGYHSLPSDYVYSGETIPPCSGTAASATPWVNLDETSQIGFNNMFAGTLQEDGDLSVQLIRFAVKANHTQYTYIAGEGLFDAATRGTKANNFTNALYDPNSGAPLANPSIPDQASVVRFPPGTIEVKAGWRQLSSTEDPNNFHMQSVRIYQNDTAQPGKPCYEDKEWGLVSLHIMSRVTSTPDYFTFATFEYTDNILTAGGDAVEDADGNVIVPATGSSTEPALTYADGDTPAVSIVGDSFCTDPGNRLFYVNNASGTFQPPHSATIDKYGFGIDANICINRRNRPIPPEVVAVNAGAHDAINAYVGEPSVWDNYKLVGVQWQPFNPTDFSDPTYYLANIVVETNYTLQNFSGFLGGSGAVPSDIAANAFPQRPPNMYTFDGGVTGFNMGGCMGCHGNAQTGAGADFSFLVAERIPASDPDFPHPDSAAMTTAKYLELFGSDSSDD